ncbi:HepT-like ribonuclease domain-containing protein [Anabaena sp. WFMT]|uniref:HepT-like ribonuclease domain-containing protein n=1 Tax=Anabaena sp. WFMT TaxID=3449730 RepID=UPI003F21FEC0
MKNERLYLSNIKECIERIEEYTQGGKEEFMQTKMIQDAVIRNFEIIGEATKRLSPDLRSKYSDVPWQQMAGLRDVLIHDYLKVNLNLVWQIIEQNLADLKSQVTTILQNLSEG